MSESKDSFTSPWGGLALIPLGCVLGGFAVKAMTAKQLSYTDRLGVQRVLRGDYLALYAWLFLIAGIALVVAGIAVFIREKRRQRKVSAA